MNLQLSGKRALVTGSSSGIGESIAKTLAGEGVSVVTHGRNEERTRRVAAEIGKEGGRAFVAIGDLVTDDGAAAVAQQTLDALGGLDILINNAVAQTGVHRAGLMRHALIGAPFSTKTYSRPFAWCST
jgi:3-oxoacyl-[acyl-carrier protein] reductase